MKEFPNEWCTDVCPEVIKYLNEKYNTAYAGKDKFYGVRNYAWSSNTIFGTYISHEEFMELAGLATKTMKVGDMVWVSDRSKEDAMENEIERELLAILPGDIIGKYIVRGGRYGSSEKWEHAIPVVKEEKKERKLMLTDQEWEKLEKVYK